MGNWGRPSIYDYDSCRIYAVDTDGRYWSIKKFPDNRGRGFVLLCRSTDGVYEGMEILGHDGRTSRIKGNTGNAEWDSDGCGWSGGDVPAGRVTKVKPL